MGVYIYFTFVVQCCAWEILYLRHYSIGIDRIFRIFFTTANEGSVLHYVSVHLNFAGIRTA